MNTLLIFFALPVATIIISIALQKILKCPALVAGIIFAVFLIVTFVIGNLNLLIATIIYTIISFLTAFIICMICPFLSNQNDENNSNCSCNCGCGNNQSAEESDVMSCNNRFYNTAYRNSRRR